MMYGGGRQPLVASNGGNGRNIAPHRIDFQQRGPANVADNQQRLRVAQHIGKQMGLFVDQLAGIEIPQQRADLVNARDQRRIVTYYELLTQPIVECAAHHG